MTERSESDASRGEGDVVLGPTVTANAAKVLESALGLVWTGILEDRGRPPGEAWEVVIGDLRLRKAQNPPGPNGSLPSPSGGVGVPAASTGATQATGGSG